MSYPDGCFKTITVQGLGVSKPQRVRQESNTLDNVRVRYITTDLKEKTVAVKDFVKLNQKDLDLCNYELLSAFKTLYELNDRKPPLFKSFPNRPDAPLTVDGMSLLCCLVRPQDSSTLAYFLPDENVIRFKTATLNVEVLAHELKHAEQCSSEFVRIQDQEGLASHQLGYLSEAQAFAFSDYIRLIVCLKEGWDFKEISENFPYLNNALEESVNNGGLNRTAFEQERMRFHLYRIFEGHYRNLYFSEKFIRDDDKGLSFIPESFNIKDKDFKQEMIARLKDIPREPKEPGARFLKLLSEGNELKTTGFMLFNIFNLLGGKRGRTKFFSIERYDQVLNSAYDVLMNRAIYKDLRPDEFNDLLDNLTRWGVNLEKNKNRGTTLHAAALNEEALDVLIYKNVIGKDNIFEVAQIASKHKNADMVEVIGRRCKKYGWRNVEKVSSHHLSVSVDGLRQKTIQNQRM